ncbi:class I mannose-6-phosphate isomerase [Leeuwenhoekiella marinoflava]|uniref:class I mannose-6-phosphate isomerase n=1 Tax=Leeuwenhoekiella marinoflava TaxID=988 RepID=UPI003001C46D
MLKEEKKYQVKSSILERKTEQFLMPGIKEKNNTYSDFDLYPSFDLGSGKIHRGYDSLAIIIASKKVVCLDGFLGVNWGLIVDGITSFFEDEGLSFNLIDISKNLKPENEIQAMIQPFLGEEESVWGTKCDLEIKDFFDEQKLNLLKIDEEADVNVVFGCGASLVNFEHTLFYFDLPKNELQYRMRAGEAYNLGVFGKRENFKMYKQYYFVDWVVLTAEKSRLSKNIEVMIDAQDQLEPSWTFMKDVRAALTKMSTSSFRVRPWFEPGAWGGEWIKEHIEGLNKDTVNYAWAFSLIVPENGLIFESDRLLLEISFDFLMHQEAENILGRHHKTFGSEFPIRFNFLDTYKGGNLSVQCHPSLNYIQEVFGETITQDECYYILDCDENASVYLGFQENINPEKFRSELVKSQEENLELTITDYVQQHPSKKHDLYLIPNGTVHSAGAGNMVLEISATPYIFTFKMYDWLRLDLDGKPRPINIDHAFNNLKFDLKGDIVKNELFSHTQELQKGDDFKIIHYPTHREHFYDVRRLDFDTTIEIETLESCHVMMLVEGEQIILEIENGKSERLCYGETFVIPAAAKLFKLSNLGSGRAKVINAYLK